MRYGDGRTDTRGRWGGDMEADASERDPDRAPSLEVIESITAMALATLPEDFRRHVGNVRIQVDDFPSDDVEREMKLDTPFDLLGLYQGVPLLRRGPDHDPNAIDRIFIYRRPILDYWCESGEPLSHIVRHVLIHEIGCHFGLTNEDMEKVEIRAQAASSLDDATSRLLDRLGRSES